MKISELVTEGTELLERIKANQRAKNAVVSRKPTDNDDPLEPHNQGYTHATKGKSDYEKAYHRNTEKIRLSLMKPNK